ncbi:MAG: hypothetical protein J6S69_08190 [Proteobacteria bacterium]|nr:hypothetical protein [Pseudomonadota bacterium]
MLETKAMSKAQEKKQAQVAESSVAKSVTPASKEQEKKSPETLLSEAISAKDGAAALSAIEGATEAELTSLGANTTLMLSLAKGLTGAHRNSCMDALYHYVVSEEAMTEFVQVKYGVKVGAGTLKGKIFKFSYMDQEDQWTANGLKHLYYSLSLLPKSHVDKVSSITTENSKDGSGGFAVWTLGCYNVNYTDANTARQAGRGYCESAADYKYSLNSLNCTMVHELGHIVDAGQKYSKREDFRKISGWKDEGKNAKKVASAIEAQIDTPFGESLEGEELEIAREGARQLIKNRVTSYDQGKIYAQVKKAYETRGKRLDPENEKQGWAKKALNWVTGKKDKGSYRKYTDLRAVLLNSQVYKHIINSFADAGSGMPWYQGLRSYMKGRQIHEGYENRGWFSFNNSAWSQKISMYQFRDPGEEFAELYASYHVARPKGSKTSAEHKAWFEGLGLHTDDPSGKETGTKISPYEA